VDPVLVTNCQLWPFPAKKGKSLHQTSFPLICKYRASAGEGGGRERKKGRSFLPFLSPLSPEHSWPKEREKRGRRGRRKGVLPSVVKYIVGAERRGKGRGKRLNKGVLVAG